MAHAALNRVIEATLGGDTKVALTPDVVEMLRRQAIRDLNDELRSVEQANHRGWTSVQKVSAGSAADAVRSLAITAQGGKGLYVAVPARSWKPVKVVVETKQTVKLG